MIPTNLDKMQMNDLKEALRGDNNFKPIESYLLDRARWFEKNLVAVDPNDVARVSAMQAKCLSLYDLVSDLNELRPKSM